MGFLAEIWEWIRDKIKPLLEPIWRRISDLSTRFKELLDGFVKRVREIIDPIISGIRQTISGIVEKVKQTWEATLGQVRQALGKRLWQLREWIGKQLSGVREAIWGTRAEIDRRVADTRLWVLSQLDIFRKQLLIWMGDFMEKIFYDLHEYRRAMAREFEPIIRPRIEEAWKRGEVWERIKSR